MPETRARQVGNDPEVWVTGAGIVSALGLGLKEHARALAAAGSGLARHQLFAGRPPDPCLCGMVPRRVLDRSIEQSGPDRATLLLQMALDQSLASAGLAVDPVGGARVQADLMVGTTLGNMHAGTQLYQAMRQGQEPDLASMRQFLPCAAAASAARSHQLQGRCWTVASACGSAAAALGHAYLRVRAGLGERIIAGGFEALCPYVVAGFSSLRLVSDEPCQPFDQERKGLNPGEGAALLVMESARSARARGHRPLARLAGYGETLEAFHHTRAHPEGQGVARAMQQALHAAGLRPEQVQGLHLHGTATAANDLSEHRACRSLCGEHLSRIPACSTKPMTGHTFGASGAISLVLSLLMLQAGQIGPTLNTKNLDPAFSGLQISPRPLAVSRLRWIMTTALGFGGEAFALLLERAEE